jgi:lipopolysaccharide export LptBFGC system permease protein LptF
VVSSIVVVAGAIPGCVVYGLRVKLQLSILRELLVSFLFAVGGMFVLALPAVAVAAVSKLQGVPTRDVLRFMPILLAGLAPYVLPLGFLLAVVVTYGRLAADNEWTAIRMAGWNPARMFLPGIVLAAALGYFNHYLAADFLPQVRRFQTQHVKTAFRDALTEIAPGTTELSFGKFFLSAERREGDDFLDAFIYIPARKGREPQRLLAERVHFRFEGNLMFVQLKRARIVVGNADFQNENPVFRLDLDELVQDKQENFDRLRYRSSDDIHAELARGVPDRKRRHELRYEVQSRWAIASTYLMFLFLGGATGLLLRKGTQLGALGISVGYALLYYVLSMRLGKELTYSSVIPPELGAWAVVAGGLLLGVLLMRKALSQ